MLWKEAMFGYAYHNVPFLTFVDGFGCVNRLRDLFIYLQLYFGIYSYALSSVNYFNVTVMQKMNHPLVYVCMCTFV